MKRTFSFVFLLVNFVLVVNWQGKPFLFLLEVIVCLDFTFNIDFAETLVLTYAIPRDARTFLQTFLSSVVSSV